MTRTCAGVLLITAAAVLANSSSTVSAACQGPDLAIAGFDLQTIQKSQRGTFDFELQCIVENRGSLDYSDSGRAGIELVSHDTAGDTEGKRLRFHRLRSLSRGEQLRTGRWVLDWPRNGKPSNSFECRIVYGSEQSAGNETNHDCDMSDNRAVISGREVLRLLSQPAREKLPDAVKPD